MGKLPEKWGGDPYVFYLLLFKKIEMSYKKIEMSYKNRLICLAK